MSRLMFDGVTPASVPAGAAAYAGYNQGKYQSLPGLVAKFPGALHVSICVQATGSARVLDVETSDATAEEAPGWVTRMRAAGEPYPVVYCNEENGWAAVRAAFAAQAVSEPLYWVANYVDDPTKLPAIPEGAIGIQFYDYGGYDASLIADYWPGLDPAPEAQSLKIPILEEDEVSTTSVNGRAGLPWAAGKKHVLEVQYNGNGAIELDVELKFPTGPWYSANNGGPWKVTGGSGTWEIPTNLIAACRGVILTPHAGSAVVVYDATAV